jgi:hypothetical protein
MKEEPTAKKPARNTMMFGALKRQSPFLAGVHQSNSLENPITRNLCGRPPTFFQRGVTVIFLHTSTSQFLFGKLHLLKQISQMYILQNDASATCIQLKDIVLQEVELVNLH